jgi:NAD-dependent deacetylase
MSRARTSSASGGRRELLDAVAVLLTQARSALFVTGSGMSVESGLPIYRGLPGLRREDPDDGALFEAGLAIQTLTRKPNTTWKFLLDMDREVRAVEPNRGHAVLVALERELPRTAVLTVNVDRLHQRAGSRNVIEMHGALHDLLCTRCEISTRHDGFDQLDIPPVCAHCGGVLRPDMPLFGEPLPADPFTRLQAELDDGFDIVFAIGVPTMFAYLARPLLVAKSEGIPTVEIGTQPTDVSTVVDFKLRGKPSEVLAAIHDAFELLPRRARV